MNFIKPSVEIITEPDLFKRIEIGARCCYKSESKITDESAQKMIPALIKRGHESPLEHSNIVIRCVGGFHERLIDQIDFVKCRFGGILSLHITDRCDADHQYEDIYISGNLRAWRNLCILCKSSVLTYLFKNKPGFEDIQEWDESGFWPTIDKEHSVEYLGNNIETPYERNNIVTARFICDRGVSHELVRHRCLSFSQESTRYCRYEDGLMFIEPWWWPQEQETSDTALVRMACQAAEDAYCSMINSGCSPQKARCVLPNMLKTEVVATGTVEQWKTMVLPLRLSKAAHPDIRRLMELFCQQLCWDPDDFRK